jgi:hypothetical protein
MNRSTMTDGVTYARFTQMVVGLAGVAYLLTGIALLFAPAWFFLAIGHFLPFNRHYEGDLGSFLLPLGIGLLVAARDPADTSDTTDTNIGVQTVHPEYSQLLTNKNIWPKE